MDFLQPLLLTTSPLQPCPMSKETYYSVKRDLLQPFPLLTMDTASAIQRNIFSNSIALLLAVSFAALLSPRDSKHVVSTSLYDLSVALRRRLVNLFVLRPAHRQSNGNEQVHFLCVCRYTNSASTMHSEWGKYSGLNA
jgi:hypothetical protein